MGCLGAAAPCPPSSVVGNRGAVCSRSAPQTPLLSSLVRGNSSACVNRRRVRMAAWKKELGGAWSGFGAAFLLG